MEGDRGEAVERFRLYAQRAEKELSAYNLNQLAHRIAMLLEGEAGMAAVDAELKTEHERRGE
jgi:hypothetical protein